MSMDFKTCLFGGFDRSDVIAYIEKMARENQERIAALEKENDKLKRISDEMKSELMQLRQRSAGIEAELEKSRALGAEVAGLRESNQRLESETESLRVQAQEYQAMKDHIAEIEINAHRRTEEFRARAVAKLQETVAQQRSWCEEARMRYVALNEQLAEKLHQAQQMLKEPDMAGFEQMERELQELSDSLGE